MTQPSLRHGISAYIIQKVVNFRHIPALMTFNTPRRLVYLQTLVHFQNKMWVYPLLALIGSAVAREFPTNTAGTAFHSHFPEVGNSIRLRNLRQQEKQQLGTNVYADLPKWALNGQYEEGPVSPRSLVLDESDSATCLTIGQVLEMIPDASRFLQLLAYSGMRTILLDDPKIMTTLIVPQDAAFAAPIPDSNEYGANMAALIENRPDVINSLIGASVWKGLYPSSSLSRSGVKIPTSNSLGGTEAPPLEVEIMLNGSEPVIQAQGSKANIVAKDIAACGPSVIHIVDNVLLPFSFDDQPKDRLTLDDTGGGQQSNVDIQAAIAEEQIFNTGFNWRQFFG